MFLDCYSQRPNLEHILDHIHLIGYDGPDGVYINATAFEIEVDNNKYLATSSHVFHGLNSQHLRMFTVHNDSITYFDAELLRHNDLRVDVILIKSPNFNYSRSSLEIGESPTVGDECLMIGFPYGLFERGKAKPTPLIRKGIVSAYGNFNNLESIKKHIDSPLRGIRLTIADIISDPGFSGSPLLVRYENGRKIAVVGVVGGAMLPYVNINNTPIQVNYGITRAFDVQYIFEILDGN